MTCLEVIRLLCKRKIINIVLYINYSIINIIIIITGISNWIYSITFIN